MNDAAEIALRCGDVDDETGRACSEDREHDGDHSAVEAGLTSRGFELVVYKWPASFPGEPSK